MMTITNCECVVWLLLIYQALPPFLPLYFQLSVESAALLMTPFQHLKVPLDLRQILLCRMKGSLSLLELKLLLAQLLLLL